MDTTSGPRPTNKGGCSLCCFATWFCASCLLLSGIGALVFGLIFRGLLDAIHEDVFERAAIIDFDDDEIWSDESVKEFTNPDNPYTMNIYNITNPVEVMQGLEKPKMDIIVIPTLYKEKMAYEFKEDDTVYEYWSSWDYFLAESCSNWDCELMDKDWAEAFLDQEIYTTNPVYVGGVAKEFTDEVTASFGLGDKVFANLKGQFAVETIPSATAGAPNVHTNQLFPTIRMQSFMGALTQVEATFSTLGGAAAFQAQWNNGGAGAGTLYQGTWAGRAGIPNFNTDSTLLPLRGIERVHQDFDGDATPLPFEEADLADMIALATPHPAGGTFLQGLQAQVAGGAIEGAVVPTTDDVRKLPLDAADVAKLLTAGACSLTIPDDSPSGQGLKAIMAQFNVPIDTTGPMACDIRSTAGLTFWLMVNVALTFNPPLIAVLPATGKLNLLNALTLDWLELDWVEDELSGAAVIQMGHYVGTQLSKQNNYLWYVATAGVNAATLAGGGAPSAAMVGMQYGAVDYVSMGLHQFATSEVSLASGAKSLLLKPVWQNLAPELSVHGVEGLDKDQASDLLDWLAQACTWQVQDWSADPIVGAFTGNLPIVSGNVIAGGLQIFNNFAPVAGLDAAFGSAQLFMNEAAGRLSGCNVVSLATDLGMNSATAAAFFTYVANMVEDYVVVNGASSLLKYNGLGVAADGSAMANLTPEQRTEQNQGIPPGNTGPIIKRTLRQFMYGWYDDVFKTIDAVAGEAFLNDIGLPMQDRLWNGFYGPRLTTEDEVKGNFPDKALNAEQAKYSPLDEGFAGVYGDMTRQYSYYTGKKRDPEIMSYGQWRTIWKFKSFEDIKEASWDEDDGFVRSLSCPSLRLQARVDPPLDDPDTAEDESCFVWLEEVKMAGTSFGQMEPNQEDKDPAGEKCTIYGETETFCFDLWVSQALRNLQFYYEKPIEIKDIDMNKYNFNYDQIDRTKEITKPFRFGNPEGKDESVNPWDWQKTDPNKIIPLTHYTQGTPLYVGPPVFGKLAEEERNKFDGIPEFDEDKHSAWFALEPLSGKGMSLRKRFQYSLKIDRAILNSKAWGGMFEALYGDETPPEADKQFGMFPMIWASDDNEINDDDADDFVFNVYTMRDIADAAVWQGILICLVCFAFAFWLIYFGCTGRGCCACCGGNKGNGERIRDI